MKCVKTIMPMPLTHTKHNTLHNRKDKITFIKS